MANIFQAFESIATLEAERTNIRSLDTVLITPLLKGNDSGFTVIVGNTPLPLTDTVAAAPPPMFVMLPL